MIYRAEVSIRDLRSRELGLHVRVVAARDQAIRRYEAASISTTAARRRNRHATGVPRCHVFRLLQVPTRPAAAAGPVRNASCAAHEKSTIVAAASTTFPV